MNRLLLIAFFLLPMTAGECLGWGLTGHKLVTDRAVRLLPTELQDFYWANRHVLADLCVHPDLRKDWDRAEGPKHYIDLEGYPDDLPQRREDAIRRFGMDKLTDSGWVPWNTQEVYQNLVSAMRRKDYPDILRLSGDLSHYVADLHVPLHTTVNYDGQLTTDTGVHARFESRLVDLFPDALPFEPKPAARIQDVPTRLWAILLASTTAVDDVFESDRRSTGADPADGYSIAKARQNFGPLAARRLNDAAHEVASFWYTAWVEAGRPKLPWADFSALVKPKTYPYGELLFYAGRYTQEIPPDWPLIVRDAFRRIEDYLRLATPVRVAKVHWSQTARDPALRVTALETTAPVDEKACVQALRRLLVEVKVKFSAEE